MLNRIRGLSDRTEFAIVTVAGFGLFSLSSILWFINYFVAESAIEPTLFTNESLYGLVVYELAILAVIAPFLRIRGWTLGDFNLHISFKSTGAGIVLAVSYYIIFFAIYTFFSSLGLNIYSSLAVPAAENPDLDMLAIVAVSIINPFFEEILVVGYVLAATNKRKGLWYSINLSILIRLVYHLYQGSIAAISIIPLGWIFVYVYLRWRRLWPLIVAHGIIDYIGFYTYRS